MVVWWLSVRPVFYPYPAGLSLPLSCRLSGHWTAPWTDPDGREAVSTPVPNLHVGSRGFVSLAAGARQRTQYYEEYDCCYSKENQKQPHHNLQQHRHLTGKNRITHRWGAPNGTRRLRGWGVVLATPSTKRSIFSKTQLEKGDFRPVIYLFLQARKRAPITRGWIGVYSGRTSCTLWPTATPAAIQRTWSTSQKVQ